MKTLRTLTLAVIIMALMLAGVGSLGAYDEFNTNTDVLFRFNETSGTSAEDSTSALTGTLQNGAVFTSSNCRFGYCLSLDGSNDRVDVPDSSAKALPASTDSLAVEAWIRSTNALTGPYIVAKIGRATGSDNPAYALYLSGTGLLTFRVRTDSGTASCQVTGSTGITDSKLHHVAGTYDGNAGTGEVKVYVDGSLDGTTSSCGTGDVGSGDSTQDLLIGAYRSGTTSYSNHFAGTIDEVRIIANNEAAASIQQGFNGGLVFNEVYWKTGGSEWFELYNAGSASIDAEDILFVGYDGTSDTTYTPTGGTHTVDAGDFVQVFDTGQAGADTNCSGATTSCTWYVDNGSPSALVVTAPSAVNAENCRSLTMYYDGTGTAPSAGNRVAIDHVTYGERQSGNNCTAAGNGFTNATNFGFWRASGNDDHIVGTSFIGASSSIFLNLDGDNESRTPSGGSGIKFYWWTAGNGSPTPGATNDGMATAVTLSTFNARFSGARGGLPVGLLIALGAAVALVTGDFYLRRRRLQNG